MFESHTLDLIVIASQSAASWLIAPQRQRLWRCLAGLGALCHPQIYNDVINMRTRFRLFRVLALTNTRERREMWFSVGWEAMCEFLCIFYCIDLGHTPAEHISQFVGRVLVNVLWMGIVCVILLVE